VPLRHPPPDRDPSRLSCAYLRHLVEAAVGLPLGPAAAMLASPRSRGRHGSALEWHLGLTPHDASAEPDWEGRIEIKLVRVWRSAGAIVCDKIKVCDADCDPWKKLANVLFVFADRTTRVVVGHAFFHLAGAARQRLAEAWGLDTHFDKPLVFVESRDSADGPTPAYYLAASWPAIEGLLPRDDEAILDAPKLPPRAGDPILATVDDGQLRAGPSPNLVTVRCPRCRAPMHFDPAALREHGSAPAHHGHPLRKPCAAREHLVVRRDRLPRPGFATPAEAIAILEEREPPGHTTRLSDRIPEPDDHGH
jgi:hypothetical protein